MTLFTVSEPSSRPSSASSADGLAPTKVSKGFAGEGGGVGPMSTSAPCFMVINAQSTS